MPIVKNFALTVLSSLCLTGLASAADLGRLPPPPPVPADTGPSPGWYLRGDAGYSISNDPKLQLSLDGAKYAYGQSKMDNAGVFGIGAGYRFNSWLRADATIDYRSRAKLTASGADLGLEDARASISAFTGLANAYLDLGTWSGLTPYLGAGIGGSSVKFGRYSGADFAIGSHNETNFAWALMAGTAIELGSGLSIDFGYRYLNLGKSTSGYDADSLPARVKLGTRTIDAQEIRIGLRWALGGDALPAPTMPLVRSY